jgi:hypothetical protein
MAQKPAGPESRPVGIFGSFKCERIFGVCFGLKSP